MKKFFTSDLHLNTKFTRPFSSPEKYAKRILDGINQRVKPDDWLYVVGDFLNMADMDGFINDPENGGKQRALRVTPDEYLAQINGKVIIAEGNHDLNNRVKPDFKFGFVDVGRYVAFVSHYPTDSNFTELFDRREQVRWKRAVQAAAVTADFAIVGHIHTADRIRYDNQHGIVNVNVSVDVRNWLPVSTEEIVKEFQDFAQIRK